jgi:perosamine synthetase
MIPLAVPNISGNEAAYLMECVRSTYVSSVGPYVTRLEEMMAQAMSAAACAATSSGTTGLHAALTAVGVGPGDLVLLPSFTFIASANAVAHCHASPWFVDIAEDSWCLDPVRLLELLHRETVRVGDHLVHEGSGRRVAAVMPVYTLGTPADMEPIGALADEFGLPVVADAAAAIGATYRGCDLGGLARLSVISLNGNKTVTAGGGGAVVGNDNDLVALVRHLSTTARVGSDYDHDRVGYNYRMTNLQAAVGCAQLERLDEFLAAKRRIRSRYDRAFAGTPGLTSFPQPAWAESACWLSGIVVGSDNADALRANLRAKGVDARSFWKPAHMQAPYAGAPRDRLPVTEALWSRIVTLPCSTALTDAEQEQVVAAVLEGLSK